MPARKTSGGITLADVAAKLPQTFFVMRGHIQASFGLSKEETALLIAQGTFVAKYPFGKTCRVNGRVKKCRARFLRTQLLEVAEKWERQS